jgi:uncharacterized protein YdhG (YjbR/CyaY superfamily)
MSTSAFSKEEKAAMKAAVAEAKAAKEGADFAAACDSAIAGMSGDDKHFAETLHALVAEHTDLKPKTYYGMPAYMNADGKVIVFFKPAAKFKTRYATIGFQDAANLDDGNLWPTEYAVVGMAEADTKRIVTLLEKSVS